ncbi:MAG: type II secretion system F family protein [Bacillota bacterium]
MTPLRMLILGGAFVTVLCLTIGFYRLLFASRVAIRGRLAGDVGPDSGARQPGGDAERLLKEEIYRLLGRIGKIVSGRAYLKKVQDKLVKARVLIKAEELVGFSLVFSIAVLLLCWLVARSLWPAIVLGVLVFKLPVMLVERRRRKRMDNLNRQLPDALGVISNGLRAGFGFQQALSVVTQEMEPPISEEFARVIRKNQLGKPMADVLKELSESTDSDDLDMVITALLIQRQVGGNLAEVLDNVSDTVRERIRIKGEIKTLTAQGRLTALVISLLPPGVMAMIMLINPDYILTLFKEPLGMLLIGVAVVLQLMGIAALRKIINIEV